MDVGGGYCTTLCVAYLGALSQWVLVCVMCMRTECFNRKFLPLNLLSPPHPKFSVKLFDLVGFDIIL